MNQFQQNSCLRILKILEKNPSYRMFRGSPLSIQIKGVDRPIYFSYIEQKLDNKLYKSTSEFVHDVRTLFRNAQQSPNSNIFRTSASKMLSEIFETMLNQGYITNSEEGEQLFGISQELHKLANHIPYGHKEIIGQAPKACFFTDSKSILKEFSTSDSKNAKEIPAPLLKAEIKALNTDDGVMSAVQLISEIQPECIFLGHTVVFYFNKMRPQTKLELHNLIRRKLLEAACKT